MGNDISNLLSKFGATVDGYLEIEAAIDYKEPVRKAAVPKVVVEAAPAVQQRAALVAEQAALAAQAPATVARSVPPPVVVAKSVAPQQRIEPVMEPVVDAVVAPVTAPAPLPHPTAIAASVSATLPASKSAVPEAVRPQPQYSPQSHSKAQVESADSQAADLQAADAALVRRSAPVAVPAARGATLLATSAPAVMPTGVADAALPSMLRSLLGEVVQQRQSRQGAGADEAGSNDALASLPPSTPARVIAVVSPKGGVGKTTLCSALACALTRHGRVVAIDLDPQNALQYHLGVSAVPEPGASASADAPIHADLPHWRAAWREGSAGTLLVTHAVVARQGEPEIARQMAQDPQWLTRQLQAMDLQAGDVVMLDLPAGQTAYLDQALQAADQVVAVVTPDAGSFLALEHMRQALHGRNNCHYIVNKYNAARTFSQDMLEVLKRWMGPRLAGVIALDHAISEGLAYGFNPLAKVGHSPAYEQLRTISEQLHAEVAKSALAGGRAS
ncbi:cellulose synthase operon protein YhjQ [Herbaspirillum sp. AP02]|uniref:cellulose biosynthesis protein BcsQ n=1 Tax=unclassified Herbaspirillum TaxID=2624150 RepID=UPI0015DA52BC|nr:MULTISPECIES: cellulose biosynthesis protein BcsQ [unclassified Herbaspirillum]MBG7619575.1 cellulose synthase operon protein YhjQ [Herbaspirillum sp. AP02]NZD69476.1 cellulose synthase operon protein YhjQ [Herbaspirillum sp. AP21]